MLQLENWTERGGQRGIFKRLTGCGELRPTVVSSPSLNVFGRLL